MASQFEVLKRRLLSITAVVRHNVQSDVALFKLNNRSGLSRAGAFLLAFVFVLIGVVAYADFKAAATNGPAPKPQSASINIQAQHTAQVNSDSADNLTPSSPTSSNISQTTNTSGSGTSTQVTVNGQNVPVPANGTVSKTINDSNGQTSISVTNNQSSTTDKSSSSHTSLHVTSHSTSLNTEVNNVSN